MTEPDDQDTPPPEPDEGPPAPTVTHHPNGWDLVRAGTWEISIGPDGLIQLPRHLKPEEINDFVAAISTAAGYAAAKRETNAKLGATPHPPRWPAVFEGGVPAGAVRMGMLTGTNPVSTIGRPGVRLPGSGR